MRIIITSKNIGLTEALKIYTEEKIGSLKKFIDILKKDEEKKTLAEVFVEIEKETRHHQKGRVFKAKAILKLPHKNLIAQAISDDLRSAIVQVKDEMQEEIKKYKIKKKDSTIREMRKAKEKIRQT